MLPRGIGPHLHPLTESSGVAGIDPPHLRRYSPSKGLPRVGAYVNEIGVAHWCTLCTLSRSMGMVYTVCTAGLHAPQI